MGACVAKAEEVFPKRPPKGHGDPVTTVASVISESTSKSCGHDEDEGQDEDEDGRRGGVVASISGLTEDVRRGRAAAEGADDERQQQQHQDQQDRGRDADNAIKRLRLAVAQEVWPCRIMMVPLDRPAGAPAQGVPAVPSTETSHSSSSVSEGVKTLSPSVSGTVVPLRIVEKIGSGFEAKVYSARRITDSALDRLDDSGEVTAEGATDGPRPSSPAAGSSKHLNATYGASRDVALKIVKKSDPRASARCRHESVLLTKLRHPNIIRLHQVIETRHNLCLVIEKALGDIVKCVEKTGPVPEHVLRRWTFQLLSAMDYAHSRHVIHGDLKPDNILLRLDGTVAIGDWAFGKDLSMQGASAGGDFDGSENYSPPEMLLGIQGKSFAADVWSLGASIYAMACSRLPFGLVRTTADIYRVHIQPLVFPSQPRTSVEFRTMVLTMMLKNPSERGSMRSFMTCEWLASENQVQCAFHDIQQAMEPQ